MLKDDYIAKNINEFLKCVSNIRQEWFTEDDTWEPWFRGQQKAAWPLVPKLYRGEFGNYNELQNDEIEDEIREEFISRAPMFFKPRPLDEWEWYFLMQHYGTPTRLLDWSDGAILGLYFAVKDNTGEHDAAVWILDPWGLNRITMRIKKDEVISPCACGVTDKDKRQVAPWLPKQFTKKLVNLPKYPIAIYPPHIDRRISCQRSCFTIHGNDPNALEKIWKNRRYRCLARIVIPSFHIESIRNSLSMCGIDESTIFPDLDGLSRSVSDRWRTPLKNKPHKDVFTRLRPSLINKGEIGVFAIVKIKKGAYLFQNENDEMVWISENKLPSKPKVIRKLYEDFSIIKDKLYGCPPTFNRLTTSWYINHSIKPNVSCDKDYNFFAIREIEPGEELTADYSKYNDSESLKYIKYAKK